MPLSRRESCVMINPWELLRQLLSVYFVLIFLKISVILYDLFGLLDRVPIRVMDFFFNELIDILCFLKESLLLEPLAFAVLVRTTNTPLSGVWLHSGNKVVFNLVNIEPHVLSECFISVLKKKFNTFL